MEMVMLEGGAMIQKKGAIWAENNQTRQKIAQRKRDTEQRKEAKAKKDMKSKAEREIEAIVEKGKEAKAEEEQEKRFKSMDQVEAKNCAEQ